jgi:hypothetical protein
LRRGGEAAAVEEWSWKMAFFPHGLCLVEGEAGEVS